MKNIDIKNKYPHRRIGDVCKIVNGGTPKTGVKEYWGGPHAWIAPAEMGGLKSPFVKETRRMLTDKGMQNSSASPLPAHSVILSSRAPIGHLVINEIPMATNQGCRGLIPSESLHYKFLYYFLLGNKELLNDLGAGTTFKELSATNLGNVQFYLPSFDEQKRIVEILDVAFTSIDTAIANTGKSLANSQGLFDSQLRSFFMMKGSDNSCAKENNGRQDWKWARLGDLCCIDKRKYSDNSVPYVGLEHIESGTGQLASKPTPIKVKSSTFHFSRKHLLYGRLRPYLNKVFLPEFEGHCSTEIFPILCGPMLNRNFLFYWLTTDVIVAAINRTTTGTRMPRANINALLDFSFPLPPLSEQTRITDILDVLSEKKRLLIKIYGTKIKSLSELKQSFLHMAFTGQLTN